MVTTAAQAFATLKSNLEITGLQATTVSTRQTNVREVVEAGMKVLDSFLAGSYARDTMIAPLREADIDIIVVLDASYYHMFTNGRQADLLDLVRQTLRKTYTRTPDISRNGQAVTIRFDDFVVDVVPAFHRSGGGFIIPNAVTKLWIETDPKKHIELIRAANAAQSGQLVPLIKMLKGWNKTNGEVLRSFHLEVLALAIFAQVTISDYPSGVRYYFDRARSLVTHQNADPAGYGGDVGSYLNTTERIHAAAKKLNLAHERTLQAEDFAGRGYVKTAVDGWQVVFGSYFPAYG